MSISNYAELKILEHTTGKTAWTIPTNVYVKLHTADAGEAGPPRSGPTPGGVCWKLRYAPAPAPRADHPRAD